MKRDMDKVRSIMLALEERRDPYFLSYNPEPLADLDDPSEIVEYLQMLHSGGLLESTQKGVYRISWAGHEFLAKIRDDEIWSKTKAGASKLGSWSVKLLGDLAVGYIKVRAKELGLPLID
jgi:hypothetical protein